ncbi:cyanophycin synthetase [Pseudohalocynthiibacter sp. F2068]|jgi:cyanophycin synthetase|uniref:cyanophycin synthetase n=1 Tax=Pseudohalocynthiibacter sp. F2068 TaxID=2926418 RepID=UPI001FF2AC45|nr:cyanophycin synthetase [Pseudohalocynthiibacter sp. F2068]MCK0103837.1 cyanophycin synthetase [Pseudohalocynthiibacter sp. F2068]
MKIVSTNVFVGPNVWASFPVIRHVVDLGVLEEWPSVKLGTEFIDGLINALPGLEEHGCSYREPGGFIRRLREDEGTWMGHIMEHCALEIQGVAGTDVSFGRTRGTGDPGQYNMVYAYGQRDVGLAAGQLAMRLLMHLLPAPVKSQVDYEFDDAFDWEDELRSYVLSAQRREFGPSTGSLVKAAEERDIPWIRLNNYSLVQFGHGKYQQRIQATITSETRHIAVELSCDKEDTHNLLNDLGLPVPHQRMVYSAQEAVRAAKSIGHPVVVKPLDANHGRGVSIDLNTDEEVSTAFDEAKAHSKSRSILVESFVTGFDHRMLVVNNELVAVAKRVPGHVIGDGKQTIAELVEEVNTDPRRGIGHEKVLTNLELDNQAMRLMADAGVTRETVLPKDEQLFLRDTANLSTGGTAIDMTDVVHPDNRDMAERAIKALGLDVGGVDFLIDDITQSYKDIGGAIVEVNAAPGFRMHVAPSEGTPRDVSGKVIDMLFPIGTEARIPIAAITGTNGKTTTSRMLAHIMKTSGKHVGMTSTDGVYVDGKLSVKGDMTGPKSAQIVLRDPSVDFAVMETARGGLVRSGLGYQRSNVAACLNVTADHLGLRGINTVEELAVVKRVVVETATETAVLNADDINCLRMADFCQAKSICYITMNSEHALVKEHIRSGGMAVALEKGMNGDMITIYHHGLHMPVLWSHLIPAAMEGKALFNVQNAMFAAAMAYCFGVDLDNIRHGLRTFDTSFFQAPGRTNVFEEHPFKVILDYAHNPAAVNAITDLASRMDVAGRRLLVVAVPGDRRDEDVAEIARTIAGKFDHFVCRADDNRRGRGDDEIPQMLRQNLLDNGVPDDAITVIPGETQAVDHALNMAAEGDLLIILGDDSARCWKQIIYFHNDAKPEQTVSARVEEPEAFELSAVMGEGETLIRDERGVRLARNTDEDGD